MSGFLKLRQFENLDFDKCTTEFAIRDAEVIIQNMLVEANQYKLQVNGTHGFDETLDYHLQITMPKRRWRESARPEVQQLVETETRQQAELKLFLWITGTVDNPKFKLDANELRQEIARDIRAEVQELQQEIIQERNEIFGEQDTATTEDWIEEQPRPNTRNRPERNSPASQNANPTQNRPSNRNRNRARNGQDFIDER
jgi:hypothetical protein